MFLERGVEAVSLEAVAAKAGVLKATLYKHFPDKAALFEAGVLLEMERIEAAQRMRGGPTLAADLASVRHQFGMGSMGFIVSDPAVAFYNALAGELRRRPDFARRFYAVGPAAHAQISPTSWRQRVNAANLRSTIRRRRPSISSACGRASLIFNSCSG